MYTEQIDALFRYLNVRLNTKCQSSPIHLTKIVSTFHIKIAHFEFDDETSGMLVRSKKGNYIAINSKHHYHRRRFSLGHEFGHYYLGHQMDVSTLLRTDLRRPEEVEANKFSSCILMPQQIIFSLGKQSKSIREIAQWCRVSIISAAIRCRELGYRIYEADDIIGQYWLEQGDRDIVEWDLNQLSLTSC